MVYLKRFFSILNVEEHDRRKQMDRGHDPKMTPWQIKELDFPAQGEPEKGHTPRRPLEEVL